MADKIKKTYDPICKYPVMVSAYGDSEIERTYKQRVTNDTLLNAYALIDYVRASIDATAYACTGSGYHFVPRYGKEVNELHALILNEFFLNVNDEDTIDDLNVEAIMDILTFGDAYWEKVVSKKYILDWNDVVKSDSPADIIFNSDFKFPYKLYKVSAKNMKIDYKDGRISGYTQYDEMGTKGRTFTTSQIVHFRLPSPLDELYGLAPASTLDSSLANYVHSDNYNSKFFKNNGTPRLHMDLGNISQKAMENFTSYLQQALQGQPHKNLVTRGGVKVNPLGLKNSDMEFNTYQTSLMHRIFAVFRMQPGILGISEPGSPSLDNQIALFKFLAVDPIRNIVASRINKKIMQDWFRFFNLKFAFNPVDRLDLLQTASIDEKDLKNSVTVVNEVRAKRGMTRVKWGDSPILYSSDASKAILPVDDIKENKNIKK